MEHNLADSEPAGSGELGQTHYAAVGMVAVAWAKLEIAIDRTIWREAAVNERTGACITTQLTGIYPRMRALIALARLNGASHGLISELNNLADDSELLVRLRNRIVHDPWFVNAKTGEPFRLQVTADRKLDFDYHQMSTRDVIDVYDKIQAHINRFEKLVQRMFHEPRLQSGPNSS